jgi:hypothetical protein
MANNSQQFEKTIVAESEADTAGNGYSSWIWTDTDKIEGKPSREGECSMPLKC